MSKESFKIYSGKRCEEYYKKYNLVSAVHKIIDLEDIIKEVREYIEHCLNYGLTAEIAGKNIYVDGLDILEILDK